MKQQPSGFTLQLGEKLCNTLVNSIRGIVWETEPDSFKFCYVSPQAEGILGYPVQQWIREEDFWQSHTHPDDLAWCTQYCREATARGEDHEFEYRMIASDGAIVWLHDIVTVVKPNDGATRLRGIMIDITEAKLTEQKHRADEERFRLAMQGANDGVWDWDLATNEVYYSPRWKSMLGYQEEELANHLNTWSRLVHPADREPVLALARDYVAGLSEKYECEFRMRHKAGHYITVLSRAFLSRDEAGKPARLVGTHVDLTSLKQVTQALAESEERYRKLVELSPDSVFIHRRGRFVFMNLTGALLLGAKQPEELYGRQVLDFVHPDYRQSVSERIANATNHQKNPAVEITLVRCDGSTVPVEMVSVYFSYRNTDSVLAVARDISERKRMQEELVRAQRLESLGVLAGGIAHDFNNILTGILGNISLMQYQLEPATPLAKRLKSCEQAAIRASELTQQLLTFARGGAPVKKLMDPSTLIRENATFLLHGSSLGCKIELADDLWHIQADAGQISQVLHNILFNAMQAMPDGGLVTIRAANEQLNEGNPLSLPAGSYLHIAIEDQGCGIAPENLPRIFDPYFSTKSEGTGLGLASAYSVIRRHGGTISVFSTVGTGSRFSIFLPAVSEERAAKTESGRQAAMTGSGRILIMDDQQLIRDVATEILTASGFEVESCPDGREAVEKYRRRAGSDTAYDAVVMDLTVPGSMGGKEAAALILEIDPAAILIVSSGYSNDPVIADFHKFGFKGAVIKPFSATTLVAEVRRLLPRPSSEAAAG